MSDILQYFGAGTGILGAILLAANVKQSGYGFVIYLISSFSLIAWAILEGASGIVAMQTVYVICNLIGIYRWLMRPRLLATRPVAEEKATPT